MEEMCKVCHHGDTPDNPLCHPCKCKGTIKHIHKECLFLFVESSGKDFCTICKHRYVFVDIFKPGTPQRLPLRLILGGLYGRLRDAGLRIVSNVLAVGLSGLIIAINGLLILHSSEFAFRECLEFSGAIKIFLFGFLTTVVSYTNYHFYCNLVEYLRQVENRRTLRIDPLSAMNSIATDVLTSTDMDTDTHAHSFLSSINFNREDSINTFFIRDNSVDRESQSPSLQSPFIEDFDSTNATGSSEESIVFTATETQRLFSSFFGFSHFVKCINISVLWWLITLLSNSIRLDFGYKFNFLREIYLYNLSKRFLVLYVLLLGTVGVLRLLYKRFRFSNLKIVYSFAKIYHMAFLCLLHLLYFQGVGVHYIFSDIINSGEVVLDLKFSSFSRYKTVLSLIFHMTVGYSITFISRKTLFLFKDKFRKGLLFFLDDSSSNDLSIVYNISHQEVLKTIARDFVYGTSTLVVTKYIFFILRGSITNGYYSFSIRSVNKLLLLLKVLDLVSEPFAFFHKMISGLVNMVIRLMAMLLGLSNYLYGDTVKVDKTDLKRFKWLPNKHKHYRRASVRKHFEKRVTQDHIEKHFNKQNDRNYSVFYVPKYLGCKCMLVTFVALTTYVCFYLMLFRLTNLLSSFVNLDRFFDNSSDVVLIVVSGLILQALRFLIYLATSLFEMKNILEDILKYSKQTLLLVFSIIIWPLWSAFIVILLYSESLRTIYPGRLVSLLFSSSSIITFVLNRLIFTRSISEYPFSRILKKLYGFISAMTFIIICISLLRSYSFLVMIETSEVPFLLIFSISATLFYLKHCIRNVFSQFLENIKREHYLLDRRVENYEGTQID
ncbi:E3 ubiquitin-protein ligase MARCH6 [Nosema granulosis]|uniref:RING-type E3 ubiquitin transferase n=1 Tax=Nosema granulosis TaxID=83296 RepID=A0A9P6H2K8_9MICR|nr:E3 ubiquitin-protein ligase MARCH6 [Nosema granulosis]